MNIKTYSTLDINPILEGLIELKPKTVRVLGKCPPELGDDEAGAWGNHPSHYKEVTVKAYYYQGQEVPVVHGKVHLYQSRFEKPSGFSEDSISSGEYLNRYSSYTQVA